jgi:AmiR/NasT family two-component response regulator
MQSSMDISLQRFAEYHALEGAFGRRAITERAKGVLMERHHVDEQHAFQMLRDQARATHRKIVNVAEAVLTSHRLLPHDGEHGPADRESFAKTEEEG